MSQTAAAADSDIPNGGNQGGTVGMLPDIAESGSACPTATVARSCDRHIAGLLAGPGSG
jgi:hypothetical protein